MIKILHCVNSMGLGGIENFIMNVYRSLNVGEYSFDFAYADHRKSFFDDEIRAKGGRIFYMPPFRYQNPAHLAGDLSARKKFFREHARYDVCHIHASNAFSAYTRAKSALEAGIPKVIVHSHNSNGINPFLNRFFRKKLSKLNVVQLACSDTAGNWMFADHRFMILPNGILLKRFLYDEQKRNSVRSSLGIEPDRFVIGNIGRFEVVKNQTYLLRIFQAVCKKLPHSKLLLIGDGSTKSAIESEVQSLRLENVILTGNVPNPADYYSAMDAFAFPSLFEGLPLTLVEAQANGLPCFISNRISPEVILNDNVTALPIDDVSVEMWCDTIVKKSERVAKSKVKEAGYDVEDVVKKLEILWSER